MDFRGKLILAPLSGITDSTFRLLCRENGADAVLTEMASAKGLLMQPERSRRFLEYSEAERPVGAQLFGASPGEIGEAAAVIGSMGFDFVDINMGCPVRKVTGGGAGSALLANPELAGEIAAAAVRNAGIPVTAKIRSGFGTEPESYLDVARALFEAGAAAVTLHPRTRGQMFSGHADWSRIAALKEKFPGRVIVGNGDVRLPEDAFRMFSETGCDAVMVGRAALGNPWIFGAMRRDLAQRVAAVGPIGPGGPFDPGGPVGPAGAVGHQCAPSIPESSPPEKRALILRHGEEMHRRLGDPGIREMRKHLAWYSRGIPGAAAFRGELVRVSTIEDFRAAVGHFF